MVPRGMRVLTGDEAFLHSDLVSRLTQIAKSNGLVEVIFPSVWSQSTFVAKAGEDILDQMYVFKDRSERDLCLVPEVTAMVQEWWRDTQRLPGAPKTYGMYYVSRCYRYERPQAGRYREFTQFGVELLGNYENDALQARQLVVAMMEATLLPREVPYQFLDSVQRGLSYYVEDGFEVEVPTLGAQKQVLGGGRYDEGIGFAIGIERLALAMRGN